MRSNRTAKKGQNQSAWRKGKLQVLEMDTIKQGGKKQRQKYLK